MWNSFNKKNEINSNLTKVIEEEFKFDKITIVQSEVIPIFSKNKDVIVKACTGSGKTLSYLIPMIQHIINCIENKIKLDYDIKTNVFENECFTDDSQLKNSVSYLGILSLIILPTRELASQVYSTINTFKKNSFLNSILNPVCLIGGKKLILDINKFYKKINNQNELNLPNIIVSTPSRLNDINKEINLKYNNLEVLILDEADKIFELGFRHDLTLLLEKLNKQRRTGLFSATMNSQIESIIIAGMRNPVYIDVHINSNKLEDNFIKKDYIDKIQKDNNIIVVNDYFNQIDKIKSIKQEIPKQLKNYVVSIDNLNNKLSILLFIINKYVIQYKKKIMIFFASCNAVEYYYLILLYFLSNNFFNALTNIEDILENISKSNTVNLDKPKNTLVVNSNVNFIFKLHSKMTQKKRKKEYITFSKFENKTSGSLLLTTDLSSRGIDISQLDVVIQYDVPKNEEIFVHRVGRTARVGKKGESILFLSNNHEQQFLNYLKSKNIGLNEMYIKELKEDYNNKHLKTLENSLDQKSINIINNKLYEFNISDKWIYDKAVKTFVSYIKFYTEHDLKYLFDINLYNIGEFASSLKLLRIPRIKEILGKNITDFKNNTSLDPKSLEYKDNNIKYQMNLKAEKIAIEKEERMLRKEISQIEKEAKYTRTRQDKKKSKLRNMAKEWDDLADEERLYKKYKQGKISKEEYDNIFYKNIKNN